MRTVLSLGVVTFLAACSMSSTPRGGDCATRANTELSALQTAIQSTEVNLARGFALERRFDEATGLVTQVQVPINKAQERAKLESLNARLPDVQARTATALAQCG